MGVLENLVTESVQKFFNHPEENTQTGPAQRKDMVTLDKHHEILKNEPEIQSIYSLLSKWIIAHRNGEKL